VSSLGKFGLVLQDTAQGQISSRYVYELLIEKIIIIYCQSLDSAFSQLLSQLLYGQPELRPAILKALKVMVDVNLTVSEASPEDMVPPEGLTQQEAQENLEFLRTQSESWLAVLFNVYGSVARDFRGMIGEVVSSWVVIAGEQVHTSIISY
jgi:ribosomal RNA-processing protein 12